MKKMYLKKFAKGQALGQSKNSVAMVKEDVVFAFGVFGVVLFACAILFI